MAFPPNNARVGSLCLSLTSELEMHMIPHDTHLPIGSLLFEGINQIDLTGPFDVLSRIPNSAYRISAGSRSERIMAYARCCLGRCAAA